MSGLPPERRRWMVDRREADYFVIAEPNGGSLELPAWLLPAATREGDILELVEAPADADVRRWTIRRDADATGKATAEARALLRRMEAGGVGGDLTL